MYKSFYNLNRKPFQISSDPTFIWFGEKHKEALATLKYGILDNKGFLLLTGDVGTGKTTLINALIQSLSDDIICASVPDPGLEKLDFFNYIAASFGISHEFSTKGSFLVHFRKFLIEAYENKKKVLLIIDEAQLLTQEMLEEIRLLSNIEKTDAKLINIFFIGQNEFNEILNREQNRAVRQRLTLNYNIDPLTPDETGEYIKHRLNVSGAAYSIFDMSATQEVFMYSGGFPRRINVICDHCLLSGYVNEQKIINNTIVRECAKELKIPAHIKNRDINGFANQHTRPVPAVRPQPQQSQSQPQLQKSEPRDTENVKEKKKFRFVLNGTIFLLFVFFIWFLMFPDHYENSVKTINENIVEFKGNFLQKIPESYASFIKGKNMHSEETKKSTADPVGKKMHPVGKEFQTEKDQGLIKEKKPDEIAGSIAFGIIQPNPEGPVKKNETPQSIQPEPLDEPESDSIKKEQEDDKIKNNTVSIQEVDQEKLDPLNKIDIQKERLPLPKEKVIVRFKYNTNDFTKEGYKNIIGFADILITHPDTKILITGYTDSAGYQKYNRKLSEFRANIVKSFFMGRGIEPTQVEIKGLGSQNPVEKNDTAWGRMMNRRVEIEVIE